MGRVTSAPTTRRRATSARVPHIAAAAGAAALIGVALWLVVPGHAGYDLDYALIWGRDFSTGALPEYVAYLAPTPHPLANLAGAGASVLNGQQATDALLLLVNLSFGIAVVAAWALARSAFGRWSSLLAAVLVLTCPAFVSSTLRGSIDIPALALSLVAAAALCREQPRWRVALVALAVAGLLRPEVWLLSTAIAAWFWVTHANSRERVVVLALALTAPVLWCVADLVVTGRPLFSLTATRSLADELDRPRTAALAPVLIPVEIAVVLGTPAMLAGAGALFAFARRPPRNFTVIVGAIALSLAAFVGIGLAGLPLLARYLLFPSALLLVLAAGVALPTDGVWPAGRIAGAIVLGLLLLALPGTVRGLLDARSEGLNQRAVQRDLASLIARPEFRAARRGCERLSVASYRLVPQVAYLAGIPPSAIDDTPARSRGLLILPRSGRAAETLVGPGDKQPPLLRPGPGFVIAPRIVSRDWVVATACRTVSR